MWGGEKSAFSTASSSRFVTFPFTHNEDILMPQPVHTALNFQEFQFLDEFCLTLVMCNTVFLDYMKTRPALNNFYIREAQNAAGAFYRTVIK